MLLLISQWADADDFLESYTARLSAADHFSDSGQRLTSVPTIIRQDRANYHKNINRDSEDTGDRYFANRNNRELLEVMLRRGSAAPEVINEIVNGVPLVRVNIYREHIEIFFVR